MSVYNAFGGGVCHILYDCGKVTGSDKQLAA